MSTTISTAAHEYATRPHDERFASVESLIQNAQEDKRLSREVSYPLGELKVVEQEHNRLALQSPRSVGQFTHWSFGQLARTVGAPANYLRELPAHLSAEALNFGIQSHADTKAELLVRAPNGKPEPLIRSINSEKYGRLWDADLYTNLLAQFPSSSAWGLPPSWSGDPMGAYRGDRDSFVTICNGGSIVTDPSVQGRGGELYRGLLIRNSEVGAAAVTIECILYEYVCGNNNYWGAVIDKQFRRRHIGTHVLRDTVREIGKIAQRWVGRSAAQDEAIIQALIKTEVANTKEDVIAELRAVGYSKGQAVDAYTTCEKNFEASPRSFWGISQGTTKLSQATPYQDERHELDKLAGLILAQGARLVAA